MEYTKLFAILILCIIITTAVTTILLVTIYKEQIRHNKTTENILLNIRWNNYRTANKIVNFKDQKEAD